MKGEVGQVLEIAANPKIYQWLSVPSDWLSPFHPANPYSFNKEYLKLVSNEVDFFFKVADEGDFWVAKLLYIRHGVGPHGSRQERGWKKGLHIIYPYNLVERLLVDAKVDVNGPDS